MLPRLFSEINLVLPVNASIGWLTILVAYFCQSYQSHAEYNSQMIEVDWLAADVLQREVGAGLP